MDNGDPSIEFLLIDARRGSITYFQSPSILAANMLGRDMRDYIFIKQYHVRDQNPDNRMLKFPSTDVSYLELQLQLL